MKNINMLYSRKGLSGLFLFFTFLFCESEAQIPKLLGAKLKKVEKKPFNYEYPTMPISSGNSEVDKPWIVYSDRKDNVVYADEKLSKPTVKINFLDSFYVSKISGDAFELVKYNSGLIKAPNVIQEPDKAEVVGWIDKSRLVLNDNSFLDASYKRPIKFVTILNGTKVFETIKKYSDGQRIKCFYDPELSVEVDTSKVSFDQVVYVYRQYKDKFLIGKTPKFNTKDASRQIIGWVPQNFVQSWGTRLCIEPIDDSPKMVSQTAVYALKEQALNFKSNAYTNYPMKRTGCDINEHLWDKTPVFSIEYKNEGSLTYKYMKTGVVLNPFDRSNSYIYNINGGKLPYSKLCDMMDKSKNVNVVFAINTDNDTKEYLYVLTNTIQDLGSYFSGKNDEYNFKFGVVNCSASYAELPDFKDKYTEVLPKLINMAKSSVENKKSATTYGVVNGLSNANRYFKGLEKETNIVVVISSQADGGFGDNAYKVASEKMTDILAKSNARVIFYQPFNGNGNEYSMFVQQAKSVIKRTAEKISVSKRENSVGTKLDNSNMNSFRGVVMGANNVYCLDFPQNSNSQGFIVFPTVGNKTEGKFLNDAIDSLMVQIASDNLYMIKSISTVFNSPSVFNNQISKAFEKYYSGNEAINKDNYSFLKNINYNYYASGYTIVPRDPNLTVDYFKQSLFLSKDEYDEMYDMFKSLRFDVLANQYDDFNKQACHKAIGKIIDTYAAKKQGNISKDISLGYFFNEICGYTPDNNVLHAFNVNSFASNTINEGELKSILNVVNRKLQKFYSLKYNSRYQYNSNGQFYYWVTEDFLP